MSLNPGTTLGPYSVTAKIGEGGMGEVYRARDTKLDRDVALKVLPQAFTDDPDRLARFEREAKVLASLNHPNIGHIYGLEEAEGTRALVLELIEGPTLADRISQGPIPVDEVLPIAKQIAEALEAAHEAGVIHRDLKPANIKLRPDGTVKVLDFGLAKALDTAPEGDPSLSPTLTAAATQMGVIMGTAAYMSPEQAVGKSVDKRSDVWSFGVVLFEMLTGQQLFQGETVSHVLASVLKTEPDWELLRTDTPPAIHRLLRRSLAKDWRRRLPDVGVALLEIDEALTNPEESGSPVPAPRSSRGWRWAAPWAAGLVLAVTSSVVVWNLAGSDGLRVSRFTVTAPALPAAFSDVLSADGQMIAFTNTRGPQAGAFSDELYIRSLDTLDAVPLRGSAGTIPYAFSPAGDWLLVSDYATMKKVPLAGGPAVTISRDPYGIADWGAGDVVVSGSHGEGLWSVSAAGGELRQLLAPTEGDGGLYYGPRFLPSGRAVLFYIWGGSVETSDVAIYDFDTGQHKILLSGSSPQFAPSGHLVFFREGSLWAAPFDADGLEVTGEARPVVEGVGVHGLGWAYYGVGSDGTLMYRPAYSDSPRLLVWVDRQGRETPVESAARPYQEVRLSPDGRTVVMVVQEDAANSDLWTYDLERGTPSKFTFTAGSEYRPVWSPEGDQIIFSSGQDGPWNLFRKASNGSGEMEPLKDSPNHQFATSFSPDGQTLVFEVLRGAVSNLGIFDLSLMVLDDEMSIESLLATEFDELQGSVSPDGRWLAYVSDQSGQREVYVRSFADVAGGQQQISTGGGESPVWARDGRELFYARQTPDGLMALMGVAVESGVILEAESPAILLEGAYVGPSLGGGLSYDVAPDGERFLMLKEATDDSAGVPRVVVLNWHEELKELVPTN